MSCECEELKWCLFFLIDQKTNYNFEVIVVDDGLENNKIESICKLFSLKLQIRYFFTGQKTKHKLIRHKKNRTFEEVVDEGVKISNGNNIIVLHPQMCFLESSTLDTFVKKIELNEFSITAIESCTEDLNGSYYNQVESSHGSKTNIGYMQNRNPCDCVFGFKKTINYKETERKTINLPIVKMKKSDEVVMKSWFS
jgi:hypothetical protein